MEKGINAVKVLLRHGIIVAGTAYDLRCQGCYARLLQLLKQLNYSRLPLFFALAIVACGGGQVQNLGLSETPVVRSPPGGPPLVSGSITPAGCQILVNSTAAAKLRTDTCSNGRNNLTKSADTDGDTIADVVDNCRLVANVQQFNNDTDEFGDACDLDDDGDGLIEISTVSQLNMLRNNLAGTSLRETAATPGEQTGCGGLGASTRCYGYELVADLDLHDLEGDLSQPNWQPLGHCELANCTLRLPFTGVFEGNGYMISNLRIHGGQAGVGFFGVLGESSEVHNVRLINVSILAADYAYVGGLAGWGRGAKISNVAILMEEVLGQQIAGGDYVGGLIGAAAAATISGSVVQLTNISGTNYVGGLLGFAQGAQINVAAARFLSLIGSGAYVGGLVGDGQEGVLRNAAVYGASISGNAYVGGLVGDGYNATISGSLVAVGSLLGSVAKIGGLLGTGAGGRITNSYVLVHNITGGAAAHELVGGEVPPSQLSNAYWQTGVLLHENNSQPLSTASLTASLKYGHSDSRGVPLSKSELQTGLAELNKNTYLGQDTCAAGYLAWDFRAAEYPVISCFGAAFSAAYQRQLIASLGF